MFEIEGVLGKQPNQGNFSLIQTPTGETAISRLTDY
jgi:hypothetical protein